MTGKQETQNEALDLSTYAGRWVALVRGRIAGVGHSEDEARYAAKTAYPKHTPELRFVPRDVWQQHPVLKQMWQIIKDVDASALLVGGAVRDGLLARPLHDLDFVAVGQVLDLAKASARALSGALVVLDNERDIARVVLRAQKGKRFEIDFARRQGDSWSADLQARDFTINAIGLDAEGNYLDPLDGQADLESGLIQAASERAFQADPLRMLRAVRLATELGFTIEPQTIAWIQRDASLILTVSAERIRDEIVRIIAAPQAARYTNQLDELGLLPEILPIVKLLKKEAQSHPHQWNVWKHTLGTITAVEGVLAAVGGRTMKQIAADFKSPRWALHDLQRNLESLQPALNAHLDRRVSDVRNRRLALKLAALLHDIGKPATMTLGNDQRIHFYNHDKIGARMATDWLKGLRFSRSETDLISKLVLFHLRPLMLATAPELTPKAIYRYFRKTGDAGVEVALLSLADKLATWGPDLPAPQWARHLRTVKSLLEAHFERATVINPPSLVNGSDLIRALELEAGPQIGQLLEAIREAQVSGEVHTRKQALALARRLVSEQDSQAD